MKAVALLTTRGDRERGRQPSVPDTVLHAPAGSVGATLPSGSCHSVSSHGTDLGYFVSKGLSFA